jgi:hypothetical protein
MPSGSEHHHHGGHHQHRHHHGPSKNVNAMIAMIAAFSSTALISLSPNSLLLAFPHYARGEGRHSKLLVLGQAVVAGGFY